MSQQTDLEYSRQLQEKFELYLLGLIFTLLGLAVQTANFGNSQFADIAELLGWLSLLISGLVGLSRIEFMAVVYKNIGLLTIEKQRLQAYQDAAARGTMRTVQVEGTDETLDVHDYIANRKAAITGGENLIDDLEKSTLRKYAVHKWSFVVGFVLLICARGFIPASQIISSVCR